ncbi:hypothetical protein CJ184_004340 [Actinotignum urinale]|uniref:hypothetical protein n=1 Tax=Actinotignum urinale TaxID=190146 RepID=UPI0015E119F1|nr:hypothetical protein [Actinotignum urinale]WIK58504.1 hypothetical protein CJ184_004340 [Actinotignum urinale]
MANLPPLPGRAHYPGSGNPPGHAHPKGHDAHIAGWSHLSGNTLIPGRAQPINPNPAPHVVLGTSVLADPAPGEEFIYLAMGCFWGAEKLMWELRAHFPNVTRENPVQCRREKRAFGLLHVRIFIYLTSSLFRLLSVRIPLFRFSPVEVLAC